MQVPVKYNEMMRHLDISQLAQAAHIPCCFIMRFGPDSGHKARPSLLMEYFVLSLAQIHCYGSGVRGKKAREKGKE